MSRTEGKSPSRKGLKTVQAAVAIVEAITLLVESFDVVAEAELVIVSEVLEVSLSLGMDEVVMSLGMDEVVVSLVMGEVVVSLEMEEVLVSLVTAEVAVSMGLSLELDLAWVWLGEPCRPFHRRCLATFMTSCTVWVKV